MSKNEKFIFKFYYTKNLYQLDGHVFLTKHKSTRSSISIHHMYDLVMSKNEKFIFKFYYTKNLYQLDGHVFLMKHKSDHQIAIPWVKVPRNENPEKGRGSWGPPRPPCGSRAKPWWGTRGRSPRKLLDFSNLNTPKTAQKLRKHEGKLTTFFLDMMYVIYFFFSYPSNNFFFFLHFVKGII